MLGFDGGGGHSSGGRCAPPLAPARGRSIDQAPHYGRAASRSRRRAKNFAYCRLPLALDQATDRRRSSAGSSAGKSCSHLEEPAEIISGSRREAEASRSGLARGYQMRRRSICFVFVRLFRFARRPDSTRACRCLFLVVVAVAVAHNKGQSHIVVSAATISSGQRKRRKARAQVNERRA